MMNERWTLLPGDHVRFDGHEWEVLVAGKSDDRDDNPIAIFRYRTPGQASDVIDLLRPRRELALIPRTPDSPAPTPGTTGP